MGYPRFSDEGCDGYHPGEEQPAMHNDPICTKCASQQEGPIPTECTCGYYPAADRAVEPASDLVERLWGRGRYWIVGDDKSEADARLVEQAAAALTALQQRAETLERTLCSAVSLIDAMMTNDPNEPVSEAGHVALDLWKHEAEKLRRLASKS